VATATQASKSKFHSFDDDECRKLKRQLLRNVTGQVRLFRRRRRRTASEEFK